MTRCRAGAWDRGVADRGASWWLVDQFGYTAPFRLEHSKVKPGQVTQQNGCALRAVPLESPWYAAMSRHAAHVAARVCGFGGDPDSVRPSPDGGEDKDGWKARHSLLGRLCRLVGRSARCCARCGRGRGRCRCES